MNRLFRAIFRGKHIPNPGDIYLFDEANPFKEYKVTVVAVENGWVQYRLMGGTVSELPMRSFHYCYKPYKQ